VMLIPCVGPGGRAAWIREFTLVSGQLRGGRPGSPACAKDTGDQKPSTRVGARFAESATEVVKVQCRFGARVGPGGFRCAVLSLLSS
jgi:hypothetical protein